MSARPAAVGFPDRETLLAAARRVLAQYRGTPVTLRQLYYRLVAAGAIPNNFRSYKNLGAACVAWRRAGELPMEAFEDRTRGMARYDVGRREDDPAAWLRDYLEAALGKARDYSLAKWFGQPKRVMVAVEKQALEGPFAQVCSELGADLAVCRGYPSLSFLAEVAAFLENSHGRENVLLYFGDFDPSGLDIPRAVEGDLSGFFGQDFEFRRVALTRDQATEMDLIPAPAKVTDARYGGFAAEHGDEVFELDAIEPAELQALIREAVLEHFDAGLDAEREAAEAEGRRSIESLLEGSGVQEFVDALGDDEGGQ